jgi:hypothetical protein
MELVQIINKYNYSLIKNYNKEQIHNFLIDKTVFLSDLDGNSDFSFLENEDIRKLFFNEDDEHYCELLCNPTNFEECDFNDAILYFEDIKNSFRYKNKEHFEYYDSLQELFYKVYEKHYPDEKYEHMPDCWNKEI